MRLRKTQLAAIEWRAEPRLTLPVHDLRQPEVNLGRAKKEDKPLGGQAAKLNRAAKALGL